MDSEPDCAPPKKNSAHALDSYVHRRNVKDFQYSSISATLHPLHVEVRIERNSV